MDVSDRLGRKFADYGVITYMATSAVIASPLCPSSQWRATRIGAWLEARTCIKRLCSVLDALVDDF